VRNLVLAFVLVALGLLVQMPEATARELALPVEVSTPTIVVRAERGLERDARRIAEEAPEMLEKIAADLPELPVPKRVELRLVRDAADLASVAPEGRGAPSYAVGVAYPGTNIVAVARRRGSEPVDVDRTVAHELAHMALDAAFAPHSPPRWLNEGFAYLHSADLSLARAQTMTGMAWTGNVIPLGELDASFPDREQEAHRAYAESYDLVSFLALRGRFADREDDGDRWPFRDFLAAMARGATVDEAARAHFGAPMSLLFEEWYASMRERYMLAPVGLFGLLVWAIGGVLLILAYLRKRSQARRTLRRWAAEDESAMDFAD